MGTDPGTLAMAKKKAEGGDPPTVAVKVDRAIVTRAKMIAADRGVDLAEYVSDALRGVVDRDWSKLIRKAEKGQADQ